MRLRDNRLRHLGRCFVKLSRLYIFTQNRTLLMISDIGHNDKELLYLSSKGDQAAFTTLFHQHKNKLFSFILRITKSSPLTEDLIQDIFYTLWKNRATLTGINDFDRYLFRMAQNRCINSFRQTLRDHTLLTTLSDKTVAENSPEQKLSEKEIRERLQQVLSGLPVQQKLVYTLSREYGLKYHEIARELNISPSTVKNHMAQALKTLRNQFALHRDLVSLSLTVWLVRIFLA